MRKKIFISNNMILFTNYENKTTYNLYFIKRKPKVWGLQLFHLYIEIHRAQNLVASIEIEISLLFLLHF